jgi:hypothetical protein
MKSVYQLWNIMPPWNRVLTSSMSIFQTSREHVLVALTVSTFCTGHVLGSDRSDRLASPSENKKRVTITVIVITLLYISNRFVLSEDKTYR